MTQCKLCDPAPHENVEAHTQVWMEDAEQDREGMVWVCLEHFQAIQEALR